MYNRLYRLLYHLLTSVYELFCWLKTLLHAITKRCRSYDQRCSRAAKNAASSNNVDDDDSTFLKQCKTELSKCPQHLCLVIGPEETKTVRHALRDLFRYARIMEIEHVSVYDTSGAVKDVYSYNGGASLTNGVSGTDWHENGIKTNGIECNGNGIVVPNLKAASLGLTNGHCKRSDADKHRPLEIHDITMQQGRALIAGVCRELHKSRETDAVKNLMQSRQELREKVNEMICKRLGHLPDPELCIILNSYTCTFGLLPWNTRFTEFHTLETENFNVGTFAKVLYRYARCEQRWGK